MTNPQPASLAQRTVRNVAWLGSGQAIRQGMALLTMIVLARFLGPSEFGIFAMAIFVNELAQLLVDFGIGSALIQRKELNQSMLSACFWLNVIIALVAATALVALGPLIAAYFEQPSLRWLMAATGANLVLAALSVLPQALLTRQLAFKEIALASLAGSLTGAAAAIGGAYAGIGVWALAIQPIVGTLVTLIILFACAKWAPDFSFKLAALKGLVRFSSHLLLSNVVGHLTRSLHSLILGPAAGAAVVGAINMAMMITWLPIAQFTQTVVRATFPVFARLQDEMDRFREGFYRATRIVALFSFPLMIGIASLATDLVHVVFGPKWEPAIPLIAMVAIPALVQSVTMLSGTVLLALGRTELMLRLAIAALAMTAIPLWLVKDASVATAVAVLSSTMVISSLIALSVSLQASGCRWSRYLGEISVPLLCSLLMGALIMLTASALEESRPWIRLGGLSVFGAISYLSLVWLLKKSAIEEVLRLLGRKA